VVTAPIVLSRAEQLRHDCRGVGAVEFALILPLMLLMFFGTIDISEGFAAKRKVSQIAQTVSDLTSRNTAVSDTDITNFFIIADAMLTPYDKSQLKATITQVYLDPSSKTAKTVWSRGDEKKNKNDVVSVPDALITKDTSGNWLPDQYLIVGAVKYGYVPVIGWVVAKGGLTLSQTAYTKPRQVTCVMLGTTCTPAGG